LANRGWWVAWAGGQAGRQAGRTPHFRADLGHVKTQKTKISRCGDARMRRCRDAGRWRGCSTARLRGCEAARLRGCEAARLRGCDAGKPRSSHADSEIGEHRNVIMRPSATTRPGRYRRESAGAGYPTEPGRGRPSCKAIGQTGNRSTSNQAIK
jgi:hypothetical protein